MKLLYIITIGLLLVGCGTPYYDVTLSNEGASNINVRLTLDDDIILFAESGDTDTEAIESNMYYMKLDIHDAITNTVSIIEDSIEIDGDMTCYVMQPGHEPYYWVE